jgi:hypothetical protein
MSEHPGVRARSPGTMGRRRKVGWALSLVVLFLSGSLGLSNGVRELTDALTPFQRAVSIGVLVYGVLGVVGGVALAARHPSSAWLATMWGIVVTYVASFAAIAYAGADATVVGAVASGLGSALIAAGVIWSARVSTRHTPAPDARRPTHAATIVALLVASMSGMEACRQLYPGPPVVGEGDGLITKRVRAKREPDRLIAEDLSVCWVIPEVFAGVQPGAAWRCAWRHVPRGQ